MRGKKVLVFAAVVALFCFSSPAAPAEPQAAALSSGLQESAGQNTRIINGRMASAMKDGKPLDRLLAYTPASSAFYAVAELESAPPNTKIRFSWFYAAENQHITDVETTNGNHGSDIYIYSSLTNGGNPWPKGEFRVEIYVGDRTDPDQIIDFEVE